MLKKQLAFLRALHPKEFNPGVLQISLTTLTVVMQLLLLFEYLHLTPLAITKLHTAAFTCCRSIHYTDYKSLAETDMQTPLTHQHYEFYLTTFTHPY